MPLGMTPAQIDALWDRGYRPYEIYLKNTEPVEYNGEQKAAGEIDGWDITHVFAKRDDLQSLPFFDAVIGISSISVCEQIWHGQE